MGADTGVDTLNKKQEGKNTRDSSVAFAGKLDTMGVLFLQREWLSLNQDSALAARAMYDAKGKVAKDLALNILRMYHERRREIESIAYQLNVPLQQHPANGSTAGSSIKTGEVSDASFIAAIRSRLQSADTSYQSAMKNDNNLLKDFAGRLRKKSQQELDSLKVLEKR